jgi:hypothetical protein
MPREGPQTLKHHIVSRTPWSTCHHRTAPLWTLHQPLSPDLHRQICFCFFVPARSLSSVAITSIFCLGHHQTLRRQERRKTRPLVMVTHDPSLLGPKGGGGGAAAASPRHRELTTASLRVHLSHHNIFDGAQPDIGMSCRKKHHAHYRSLVN